MARTVLEIFIFCLCCVLDCFNVLEICSPSTLHELWTQTGYVLSSCKKAISIYVALTETSKFICGHVFINIIKNRCNNCKSRGVVTKLVGVAQNCCHFVYVPVSKFKNVATMLVSIATTVVRDTHLTAPLATPSPLPSKISSGETLTSEPVLSSQDSGRRWL